MVRCLINIYVIFIITVSKIKNKILVLNLSLVIFLALSVINNLYKNKSVSFDK